MMSVTVYNWTRDGMMRSHRDTPAPEYVSLPDHLKCLAEAEAQWDQENTEKIKAVADAVALRARLAEVERERDELSLAKHDAYILQKQVERENQRLRGALERIVTEHQSYDDVGNTQYDIGVMTDTARAAAELLENLDQLQHPKYRHAYDRRLTLVEHALQQAREAMRAECARVAEDHARNGQETVDWFSCGVLGGAAMTLRWSPTRPTVPGFYWWRQDVPINGNRFPRVVEIQRVGDMLLVLGINPNAFQLDNASGEWSSGPIPMPVEPRAGEETC
jgi:hypothetical protein